MECRQHNLSLNFSCEDYLQWTWLQKENFSSKELQKDSSKHSYNHKCPPLSEILSTCNSSSKQNFVGIPDLYRRSQSLIIFVSLIGLISLISIIGNLCLIKVLYSKRFRLSQTDRIVLCLALSELCHILIDSPAEIYRFLSDSFSQTWVCRFHVFFESLFSSCIIFYHLLGAFDRFVYIHSRTSTNISAWSKLFQRISTKSCSIILLILPIIFSLPLAICNLLHTHVSTIYMRNNCVIQYAHGLLISSLICFYVLPLVFSFFFHAKLIYFICSKHHQCYYQTMTSYVVTNSLNTHVNEMRKHCLLNQNNIVSNKKLLKSKSTDPSVFIFNMNKYGSPIRNPITGPTIVTTTTTTTIAAAAGRVRLKNSSNSFASTRSSNGTNYLPKSPAIMLYKMNSQASVNAKRTVILLVLLLSFYVLCWAPYNIYTWCQVYRLVTHNHNRTLLDDTNLMTTSFNDTNKTRELGNRTILADLYRTILINYTLYLLSMISMSFSFIFYFSLNKQARHEFSQNFKWLCPRFLMTCNKRQIRANNSKQEFIHVRRRQYPIEYRQNCLPNYRPQRFEKRRLHTNPTGCVTKYFTCH